MEAGEIKIKVVQIKTRAARIRIKEIKTRIKAVQIKTKDNLLMVATIIQIIAANMFICQVPMLLLTNM